ncbi:MAG: PKD-like domain-containing protein, partial [Dolichospermum sp.]
QNVTLTGTGNYTGGTFSSTTGLSINATTGAITPSTSTPGTYVVTYTIPAGSSCLPVQTQTNVTITPKPVMTYTVTTPICDGSALNFVLSSNVPGTTYTWDASNNGLTGFNASGTQANINQVVNLTNPMVGGTITMVILPSANGCTGDPVTVNLVVNPNPVISSITVEDAQICAGSQVHIDVDGEPTGLTYTWTAVNNNGVIITSGTYSGTSLNGSLNLQLTTNSPTTIGTIQFEFTPIRNGCVGTPVLSEVITVNPIPGTPIGLPVAEICSEEITNLQISENLNIPGTILEWEVINSQNVTGFTPTGSGATPILIADTLVNDSNVQGFVIYRVKTVLGECEGPFTDFTVLVNPLPKP